MKISKSLALSLIAVLALATMNPVGACWRDRSGERRQPVRNVIKAVFGTPCTSCTTYAPSTPTYYPNHSVPPAVIQQTGGCSNGQCPVPASLPVLVRPTFTP